MSNKSYQVELGDEEIDSIINLKKLLNYYINNKAKNIYLNIDKSNSSIICLSNANNSENLTISIEDLHIFLTITKPLLVGIFMWEERSKKK